MEAVVHPMDDQRELAQNYPQQKSVTVRTQDRRLKKSFELFWIPEKLVTMVGVSLAVGFDPLVSGTRVDSLDDPSDALTHVPVALGLSHSHGSLTFLPRHPPLSIL